MSAVDWGGRGAFLTFHEFLPMVDSWEHIISVKDFVLSGNFNSIHGQ